MVKSLLITATLGSTGQLPFLFPWPFYSMVFPWMMYSYIYIQNTWYLDIRGQIFSFNFHQLIISLFIRAAHGPVWSGLIEKSDQTRNSGLEIFQTRPDQSRYQTGPENGLVWSMIFFIFLIENLK